ncbi:T9SS type A sorting domain-containing protein [Gracilimonas tropica]|uniref:T9SS type A sorting domain-containing protein n=1 Tax=Gracilimonas tropica TaxID=454600 RepID=UPI00037BC059|nr:T9SS type A sorting domain-containing protein [Gracilimonas tropica]
MKKLFGIALLIICSISALGQDNISEAYFHELRGMEDSSGVTHLFYRLYYEYGVKCSYTNYDGETETYSLNIDRNNLRQFNTSTNVDTLIFEEGERLWSECSSTYKKLYAYKPYPKDPNRLFKIASDDAFSFTPSLRNWSGNRIGLGATPGNTIGIDTVQNYLLVPTPMEHIVIKTKPEHSSLRKTLRAKLDGSNWEELSYYTEFPDSLLINFTILGVNPFHNQEYFGVKGDSLLRSTNHGDSLSLILRNDFFSSGFPKVIFDAGGNNYYFLSKWDVTPPQLSMEVMRLSFVNEEIAFSEVALENDIHAITHDPSVSGDLYLSDSTEIFISNDFGENFKSFKILNDIITGLYKKPDSDILYVLTREELLQVNTETKETLSLKKIPVSSEPEPSEIPTEISLQQNYPNPFNPTTVISYQLNSNQLVHLEVFDVTGRKVAVLVDGKQKSAGQHRVNFDGSGLSSGVYFYRLEAGGQTLTQKMLLVK